MLRFGFVAVVLTALATLAGGAVADTGKFLGTGAIRTLFSKNTVEACDRARARYYIAPRAAGRACWLRYVMEDCTPGKARKDAYAARWSVRRGAYCLTGRAGPARCYRIGVVRAGVYRFVGKGPLTGDVFRVATADPDSRGLDCKRFPR